MEDPPLARNRFVTSEQESAVQEQLERLTRRLELQEAEKDGELEALRRSLALARLELELSESTREQAVNDLSLTRYLGT